MKIQIRDEVFPVENIYARCVRLGNMAVTHVFADDRAVLGFREPVVI